MTLGFGNQYSIQLSYGRVIENLSRAFYLRMLPPRFDTSRRMSFASLHPLLRFIFKLGRVRMSTENEIGNEL